MLYLPSSLAATFLVWSFLRSFWDTLRASPDDLETHASAKWLERQERLHVQALLSSTFVPEMSSARVRAIARGGISKKAVRAVLHVPKPLRSRHRDTFYAVVMLMSGRVSTLDVEWHRHRPVSVR